MAKYHRVFTPTQDLATALKQLESKEMWGQDAMYGLMCIRAYPGALKEGRDGIEFETDIRPSSAIPGSDSMWRAEDDESIRAEEDFVKMGVKITLLRYTSAASLGKGAIWP